MITFAPLFTRVRAALDDDISKRYSETKDLVPAANAAISYLTAVFSAAFEQNKVQPEVLSELTAVLILNPDVYGNTARVNLNDHTEITPFSEKVWTIIGVDPNPSYLETPDVLYETNLRFAKRVTLEQWNYALEDPFMPGTTRSIPSDFQRVCYMGPGRYFWDGDEDDEDVYLLLRPGTLFSGDDDRIGVWVILKHPTVESGSTEVRFPPAVHELLVQKMIQSISYQHDIDKYYKMADKEVKELLQLMNT